MTRFDYPWGVTLRSELQRVVDMLLTDAPVGTGVSLDTIGQALGLLAVSQDEIDAIFVVLERAGRRVVGPSGANNEATLRIVLETARVLRGETGRAPSPAEIAARAGLDPERVRHALALARVMQR